MDYQSNNQSGGPQSTGEPYDNTNNSTNPYSNTPVNNGNPYGNENPYGNTPVNSGNPYGNENPYGSTPANNGNPYGNENPYGNTPVNNGNPYGNANPYGNTPVNNGNPCSNANPYDNTANSRTPYGNAAGTGNMYGNAPANNGNPYGNNPYNNQNPYNNPYNSGGPYNTPYNNRYPYGNVSANIITPQKTKGEGMATAAMILGIISLISLLLLRFYIPFLAGGVGIILAVLSKGGAKKMIGKARAGLICCITGLVLDIVLCISSVYLVFALPDIMPEMVDEVNEMCEDRYGMTYDEFMDELYEMWDIER